LSEDFQKQVATLYSKEKLGKLSFWM